MDGSRPPLPLRRHQREALAELERVFAAGRRRAWVVLPPGSGKTLTGLEAARRLGNPVVAFGPNTAIQGQWLREWAAFVPREAAPASTDRELTAPVTVLTYQALATFDPDAEVDEEGEEPGSHLERLRPQGRELVAALRARGPLTLLLDECHHLLDTWGELLEEVLEELPEATVIGLTATPPDRLTAEQAALVDTLFGPAVRGPSIPAVVREGHLAPFAELAWLTTPTAEETAWLAAQAERFAELTTDLLDPAFASVPFLAWLDERVVRRRGAAETPVPWRRFERDEPDLAGAALRFHFHGLLELPEGARIREEHRHAPTAADWVSLLDDYVTRCLRRGGTPEDAKALAAVRNALPSVGYQLTARGIRGGRSPIDRVLARSAAKTQAVVEIIAAEAASLGDRLRAVAVCDHERATATLPARLSGVLDEDAGSARLLLAELVRDARTGPLAPMLVTGRAVAAAAPVARAFAQFCTAAAPGLRLDPPAAAESGVVEITGSWTSRTWVALATRFFEEGGTRALIGTRAMLGEGWDARGVNTLVDLTEATTATAVVQTRGRALRVDPAWPEKVANTWSVVCVTDRHPKGTADWNRFVRKHDGYFGITDAGEIMSGVPHVHPSLSPYAPPPEGEFAHFNAMMLARAEDRAKVRELWRVGMPYEDKLVHTVRVSGPRGLVLRPPNRRGEPPAMVPAARGFAPCQTVAALPAVLAGAVATPALWVTAAVVPAVPAGWPLLLAAAAGTFLGWAVHQVRRALVGARALREAGTGPDLAAIACAVAEGLRAAGLTPGGTVVTEPDETGAYRIELDDVPPEASARFATAFDEVISSPADPRYLLPRYIVTERGLRAGWRLTAGRARPNLVVYHAVPAMLGDHRKRVDTLAKAWRRWVSSADPLYTRSPEGAGVLAAQAGEPPLSVTTAMRAAWH